MRKIPQPRTIVRNAIVNQAPNGTWMESEEITYPNGNMIRRARCICPDGKLRVVRCGIADTFWTVPAYVQPFGRGYITTEESPLDGQVQYRFNAYKGN